MTTIEAIFLVLVISIIIIAIFSFFKSIYEAGTSSDSVSLKPPPDDEKSDNPIKKELQNQQIDLPNQQIDIYKYQAQTTIRRCPFCDGENEAEATICSICGQQL